MIVGSVGRATVYNEVYGDSLHEYNLRQQEPIERTCGARGDIDLIGAPTGASENPLGPFHIDTIAFSNDKVRIIKTGGNWLLQSARRGYERMIDPEVFRPVQAVTIYGVECRVPPAKTQLALMNATGIRRAKDEKACEALSRAIEEGGLDDEVDPASLSPLYELGRLNSQSLAVRLGNVYRAVVPKAVQPKIAPAVGPIREYIDAHF